MMGGHRPPDRDLGRLDDEIRWFGIIRVVARRVHPVRARCMEETFRRNSRELVDRSIFVCPDART